MTRRLLVGVLLALTGSASTAPAASAVLVYVRPSSQEVVVARDDGSQPRVVAHRSIYALVSPDGRQLVYATTRGGGELRLMSTHGGRSWLVAHHPSAAPKFPSSGVSWSPNGRYLAVGQFEDGLVLYDVARHRRRFRSPLVSFGGASFSPDSSRLVFESDGIRENNLAVTSVSRFKVRVVARNASSPVWGRGGLAFTRRMKPAGLALKKRRSQLLVPSGSSSFLYPVEWSRDGHRLLAAQGESDFALHALMIVPSTRRVTTLSPVFSQVDALSRDGAAVLGVVNGDVVTVTASGAVSVLAHGAVNASWTH